MQFNLADLFESVADAVPEREALACGLPPSYVAQGPSLEPSPAAGGTTRLTYRQLDERANRLAHYFQSQGVGKGDHIGLYLHNCTEYLEASLAAYKVRAVPININYRYVEAELAYLFDNADLVALVHHCEFAPRIAAVAPKTQKLRTLIAVGDRSGAGSGSLSSHEYEDALAGSPPGRGFPPRSADDLYILYTGGTTGMPKGVMWRQEDIFFAAMMGGNPYGPQPERPEEVAESAKTRGMVTMLPAAPLIHGAAQWAAFINLYGGGKVVIATGKRFDPQLVWRLAAEEKVNSITIVGDAMARPLADALEGASFDLPSLRVIGSGGAILSEHVKDQLKQHLPSVVVMDNFGGSETGAQGQHVGRGASGTAPRFRADATTAVFDDMLRRLEPGCEQVGMLARTGRIPIGYYNDLEKTAKTFIEIDGERWALPGDMAMVEADGTVTLLGRGSACINSGGEKVFPEEVEAAVRSHPGVFDAVVVGVPDEKWGERVTAVVQPRDGQKLTLEALAKHCRTAVAGYKIPRGLRLVDELVRQPSGKPDYRWAKGVAMEDGA
jgi:acyl-CoA synthetase (AMP-forming)/AMP-acid ligase II